MSSVQSISDLVSRLRVAAGARGAAAAGVSTEKRVKVEVLLALHQALRRHPCLQHLSCTQGELMVVLLEEMREAEMTAPRRDTEVHEALAWVHIEAARLEVERVSAMYADAEAAVGSAETKLLAELGFEEAPAADQSSDAQGCPWRVLFSLMQDRYYDRTYLRQRRAMLEVQNPTSAVVESLHAVNNDVEDVHAWIMLLTSIADFPIASVRSVWHSALHHFPTSGPLVCCYINHELEEVGKKPRLWDGSDENEVKAVFTANLRLLATFARHLPLCASCDLYLLFLDYVEEHIRPDNTTLDELYRQSLRRDVGNFPSSMSVWLRYLAWRPTVMTDAMARREWRKKMYRRILQMPLSGLEKVKDDYTSFIEVEYRGRVAADEKNDLEKRFFRAKAEAAEVAKHMMLLYPSVCTSSGLARITFLAQRTASSEPMAQSVSFAQRSEVEQWSTWQALMALVERPLLNNDTAHYARVRSFLWARALYFMHRPNAWWDLAHYCLHSQPLLTETDRRSMCAEVLQASAPFYGGVVCMDLFATDLHMHHLAQPEESFRSLNDALLHQRSCLMELIKAPEPHALKLLSHLKNVAVLAVNWMRMDPPHQRDNLHVRLVARFTMHKIDYLSLTMNAVRKLLKLQLPNVRPGAFLRPFNTFCYHWIWYEIIRSRSPADSLAILRQWMEHLKMLLKSAEKNGWEPEEAGLDDLFLQSCANIIKADEGSYREVVKVVAELEEAVAQVPGGDGYLFLCRQFRHAWFSLTEMEGAITTYTSACDTKLLHPRVVHARYDSDWFEHPLHVDAPAPPPALLAEVPLEVKEREQAVEIYPDESLWASADEMGQDTQRSAGAAMRRRQELPAAATHLPSSSSSSPKPSRVAGKRGLTNCAHRLFTLSEQVRQNSILAPSDAPATTSTRISRLEGLEELLLALPTVHQYCPFGASEEREGPLADWILRQLSSTESLQRA